ncbi:MAG TPA: sorbosone dehydrogenase family protein [Myxococcota bacterium]|nr:sorbosone dehydrogenase family protein [Myxococcota bacterium]
MKSPVRPALALAVALAFGCGDSATLGVASGVGASPALPPPNPTLVPTVDIAPAVGWRAGVAPTPAAGLRVEAFARDLDHPRWLYRLPNGDVLVAETNAPAKRENERGLKGLLMRLAMKRTGGAVPSANRIRLLRDADHDGRAELATVFLQGLHSPFGMALVGDSLYVANTDALMRFEYRRGATELAGPGQKIVDLPAGKVNHHWTKNVIASPDGARLYVTVGSNSNVAESGLKRERGRALILEVDPATRSATVFASGLRNPNGLAFEPRTGALWTTVNERDEIGSDLVPDYLTHLERAGFYGWPYSYYGQHVDERVQPQRPELVAKALVPDYALGAHTAALGLAFNTMDCFPQRFAEGAFIGLHGSWNRKPPSGYEVIFVPFREGEPDGMPLGVLTGFLDADGNARGRPAGVALDADGALLVADDVGNAVWRVSPADSSCRRVRDSEGGARPRASSDWR